MAITKFPPVDAANPFGLLAVGGDLELATLLLAYRSGIFPWPVFDENVLAWFAPPHRAVLFFDSFHISRSLKKRLKKCLFTCTIDTAFGEVIAGCAAAPREGQRGTWITAGMQQAYIELHRAGYAHSIECWQDGMLAGGLYGVSVGGMFAGESMFHRRPDASKAALVHLVEYLRGKGVTWIDCQQLTPLFVSFGAIEIERDAFMRLLSTAVSQNVSLF